VAPHFGRSGSRRDVGDVGRARHAQDGPGTQAVDVAVECLRIGAEQADHHPFGRGAVAARE
jgi:hypothetical protein